MNENTPPLELPFANGSWRLAIGLKPLALADWIQIGEDHVEQLQVKQQLLRDRPTEVFASLPGSATAQQEVLDLLIPHLLHYFPQHYQQQGDRIINRQTEQHWRIADFAANPLDLAGRLVQEDLCVMLPSDRGYLLSAASVCFPSRWRLHEKLGKPTTQIHQPIPGYAEKLAHPVDQFFDRLKPDYPVYRLNWSIADSPDLFLVEGSSALNPEITAENAGDRLWVRVERQTLRRLPSNGILFTIRTHRYSVSEIVADPQVAQGLADAIKAMPTAMQRYKSLISIQPALLAYLDRRATGEMGSGLSVSDTQVK
ncbi:MAG TPA: DUF3445 domain-containing protein [Coleofasciculaceae cyanobacterium]